MNRFIYLLLILLAFTACLPADAQAQKKQGKPEKVAVSSRLVDEQGQAIPNALISAGEGLVETRSDAQGNFTIRTTVKTKLLVEAPGYQSFWLDLADGLPASELVLQKDVLFASGKDLVHLPLNQHATKRSLTGAVSKVSGEALASYPDLSFSNTLQGRLLGLTARQTVNGLGSNEASLYIRGLARGGSDGIITVVDGIERSLDMLVPEEVESVEVLKDATAKILYGPRAANGVLMVTTKRGKANTRMLKASVGSGMSFNTRVPSYLNSYDYATLYNEARENDGLAPFYSAADLEGYRNSSGANDQRYPNVDYYKEFLHNSAPYRKASLEYSGGNAANQYALILAYAGGSGLEKLGQKPTLDRFNLRGNLDFEINKVISASLGASGVVENRKWGSINHSSTFSALSNHRPNEYPFLINDPVLVGQGADEEGSVPPLGGSFNQAANLYGSFVYGGYAQYQSFYGQTNVGLNFKLDQILPGLSAKAYYTMDNSQYFESGKTEVPVTYAQRWFLGSQGQDTVQYYPLRKRTIEDNQSRKNQNYASNGGWTGTLAYEKVVGKHDFSTNLTHFYYKKGTDDWVQDLKFTNTTLHLRHGFSNKLYTDLTLAFMGSDKMPVKNRYNLFPAVGAAWVLSEESFLNSSPVIDFMKLKGSFGVLGYDRSTSYYLYENRWNTDGSVGFNERNTTSTNQTNLQQLANPNLGWEKSRELNVGLEGLLLKKRLQFEFNYFHTLRYDIIQSNSYRYPTSAGLLLAQVNQGENLNRGVEGQLNWSNAVGGLNYSFGGNFVFSKDKVLKMNELLYPGNAQQIAQTGQPSDALYGYVAEGLFTSQEQIDNHPRQTFGPYGLGSIAYKDLNNDGVIDNLDRAVIGNSFPRTSLGLNLDLNYKGFGLFVLGTAELGRDNWLNNSYYWNTGEGKYSALAMDSYHPTRNPDGRFPALTTTAGTNNFRGSTFWLEDASFLRLKNVELSYTLPAGKVAKAYRFYLRGTNLLLAAKNKDLDPEVLNAGVSNYPLQRTVTAGVSATF